MEIDEEYFLYISSLDSTHIFPSNNSYSFIVELPQPLNLLYGNWYCSLNEFHCKLKQGVKFGDFVEINCDIIDPSKTSSGYKQLLRRHMLERAKQRVHAQFTEKRYSKVNNNNNNNNFFITRL